MEAMEFDVSLVTTEWFLCLFSKSLPSEVRIMMPQNIYIQVVNCSRIDIFSLNQTTLRVWDVIFYEGAKVIFNVALAIFKVPVV